MIQRITSWGSYLKEKAILIFLSLVLVWIFASLIFQLYFLHLTNTQQTQVINKAVSALDNKFDGRFASNSDNIWYKGDKDIYVQNVTNLVKVGKLAGNRNLEFGVKNILEEYLQDKEYNITPDADRYIDIDILYLDQITTKKGVSVFGKTDNSVVIKLRGTLFKEGKKEKEIEVEESSSEISMTTLIVDQGGKFNQTSLSSALKKGCDKLVTKLFEK